jgi:hypothetical protein
MALILIEGFDEGLFASKGWALTSGSTPTFQTGRFGGSSIETGYQRGAFKTFVANTNTLIIGLAAQPKQLSGLTFAKLGNAGVAMTGTGLLTLIRADTSAVIATSASPVWNAANIWRYLELKTSPTSGVSEVKVDGVVVLNGTVPSVASATTVTFPNLGVGVDAWIDDIYIVDTTTAINNNYLGDVRVQTYFPSADGANTAMTPSTGTTHYNLVDEASPNTTDYVSSATAGPKDTYLFPDLSANTGNVFGVEVTNYSRKDATGDAAIANVARVGGVDYTGESKVLSASWTGNSHTWEVNPATGSLWSPSEVNNAEFGVEAT